MDSLPSAYISLCFRINEDSTETIKSLVDPENLENASKKMLKRSNEPVFYSLHGWRCFNGHESYFCKKGMYRLSILYPNLSKYDGTQKRYLSHHILIEDLPEETVRKLLTLLEKHKVGTFTQTANQRQIFDVLHGSFTTVKGVY